MEIKKINWKILYTHVHPYFDHSNAAKHGFKKFLDELSLDGGGGGGDGRSSCNLLTAKLKC